MRQHHDDMRAIITRLRALSLAAKRQLVQKVNDNSAAAAKREWASRHKQQPGYLPLNGVEVARFVHAAKAQQVDEQR